MCARLKEDKVEEVKSRSNIRLYPLPYEVLRNYTECCI